MKSFNAICKRLRHGLYSLVTNTTGVRHTTALPPSGHRHNADHPVTRSGATAWPYHYCDGNGGQYHTKQEENEKRSTIQPAKTRHPARRNSTARNWHKVEDVHPNPDKSRPSEATQAGIFARRTNSTPTIDDHRLVCLITTAREPQGRAPALTIPQIIYMESVEIEVWR